MFVLDKIGERYRHGPDFEVNRPNGVERGFVVFMHTRASLFWDGRWQEISPGTAIVFRPGQPQHYRALGEVFEDSWMSADLPATMMQGDFPFGCPIALHNTKRYRSLFHLLCDEFYSTSPQREQIIHCLGYALIHMLARETAHAAKPPLYYALIALRRDIYNHPERAWSISTMAETVAVSPGYLQKIYKQYFGVTCNQEIIQSRVDSACVLLDATNMSVERVAEACGYHNTEHFIRQFRAVIGTTPGRYRREQGNGGGPKPSTEKEKEY